jgi:hypothetical protein
MAGAGEVICLRDPAFTREVDRLLLRPSQFANETGSLPVGEFSAGAEVRARMCAVEGWFTWFFCFCCSFFFLPHAPLDTSKPRQPTLTTPALLLTTHPPFLCKVVHSGQLQGNFVAAAPPPPLRVDDACTQNVDPLPATRTRSVTLFRAQCGRLS